MDNGKEHTLPKGPADEQHDDFFSKATVPYEKTKAEVWDTMLTRTSVQKTGKSVVLGARWKWVAIAASFALLIGGGSFMRFYSHSIKVPPGKHLTAGLPDGSSVELNASTTLSYQPYWWQFKREAKLDGEAFFNVREGSQFSIRSEYGKTTVVGTSFNVYSRSGVYRVACVTGKVQVTSPVGEEVIIGPSYEAEIDPAGKILVTKKDNIETATSWKENMFSFTSVSIDKVIEEIERQYNVQIITQIEDRLTYTGFFSRDKHIEEVLDLLCKPFGLTYVKQADGVFLVTEK